jgi:hypothetical protein
MFLPKGVGDLLLEDLLQAANLHMENEKIIIFINKNKIVWWVEDDELKRFSGLGLTKNYGAVNKDTWNKLLLCFRSIYGLPILRRIK